MSERGPLLLVIAGPTAAGKSALALRVAGRIGGEIVSADSMQVYRGLDVGTAKPTAVERARVPHHLLDILDVHERYSAARFARDADAAIAAVRARGKVPIVCGGTLLYLRALLRGLLPGGDPDPALRADLESLPAEALRERLLRADPASAARIGPRDRVRMVRALELCARGRTASALRDAHGFRGARYRARVVALAPPRERLRSRIAERIERMMREGLVEETRALLAAERDAPVPPLGGLGYRQVAGALRGEYDLAEAARRARKATVAFARRQTAWMRSEPEFLRAADPDEAEALLVPHPEAASGHRFAAAELQGRDA